MTNGARRTRLTTAAVGGVLAAALGGGALAVAADHVPAHAAHAATTPTTAPAVPTPLPTSTVAAAYRGTVTQVRIPGTVSHFPARPGFVYLPAAARQKDAGRFPVVIALSGQSKHAQPSDVIVLARIQTIMDDIAARNGGRAPIVVIPDQLSAGPKNPMCVDSPIGNVDTYLTVDVRRWTLAHLPALADRQDWTIAGFSEGGTCSIQLGAKHPDIFGSLVDVSGEEVPAYGSLAHTIATGFGGSRAAYERATPFALLKAGAPYHDMRAYFGAGTNDKKLGWVAPIMARHARAAGMTVFYRPQPGKHDWRVAHAVMWWAFDRLVGWWHLSPAAAAKAAAGH
jgi:S-formylglutathione hydrolase FrmB